MATTLRFIEEFRSPESVRRLAASIQGLPDSGGNLTVMEVCGTHTMSIFRHGIRQLLPPWIRLISGPGCPVCVTDDSYIALACLLGLEHKAILVTFGDLMRVPGMGVSLEQARARGADIRVVYTPRQSLEICREKPLRQIVFLAVGFETTAPLSAALVLEAEREKLDNLSLLVAHKLVPPVMAALLSDPALNLDGFLCPPHVSAIIGSRAFDFVPNQFRKACVVVGFEPADILLGLLDLARQRLEGRCAVSNLYRRVVRESGNSRALTMLQQVFQPSDTVWRGFGSIPGSGLTLRQEFAAFDAMNRFSLTLPSSIKTGCRCGDVLRGVINPKECPLFGKSCDPDRPIGPCMVSSEGTCAAY
jgi:hydrogenase expression/formation protein HypD